MAKSLEPWESEDLTAAIEALVDSLRQCVPPERVDGGRERALVRASSELEGIAKRLGNRGPIEAMESCNRLEELRHNYDYRRDGPAVWNSKVSGIIKTLTAILNKIGADLPGRGLSKVITPAEGGRLFGVSAKTFVRWCQNGKIRAKQTIHQSLSSGRRRSAEPETAIKKSP